MADTHYTATVKNLFQEFYKRNLTMGEYRAQRKLVIDQMDREYNGAKSMDDTQHTQASSS